MQISFESLETPALTKAHLADLLFEQIGQVRLGQSRGFEGFKTDLHGVLSTTQPRSHLR